MRKVGAASISTYDKVAKMESFRSKDPVAFRMRMCPFMIICDMEACGYYKPFPTTIDYVSCSKVGKEMFELVEFDE